MRIYFEFSDCNSTDLYEAKRNLVDLMALEIRTRRQEQEVQSRIESYEAYARDALTAGEETLAQEIAVEIASMEANLSRQGRANATYYAQVSRLKAIVNDIESGRHGYGYRDDWGYGYDSSLQYTLDRLEAQAELAEGGEYRALERKMLAAGIGRRFDSGREILNRIRGQQEKS